MRLKLPRSRKPSFDESRTRQGSLFGLRSRLVTRLARLFVITRFERRPWGTGKPDIFSPRMFPTAPGIKLLTSCVTGHWDQVSAADRTHAVKQMPRDDCPRRYSNDGNREPISSS